MTTVNAIETVGKKGRALISEDGRYRYWLQRDIGPEYGNALFVMLNPSTADADEDDPTIRRCIEFAKRWGYGSLEVVNLFAWRATDSHQLREQSVYLDVIGPENDAAIKHRAYSAGMIVCAWGNQGEFMRRGRDVKRMLMASGHRLWCVGITKAGYPKHPLYIRHDREPYWFDVARDSLE